jgi:hypothetical protein
VLACLILFFLNMGRSLATYDMGGEITWKYDSGSVYTIYLNLFRAPNGLPPPSQNFDITDGTTTKNYTASNRKLAYCYAPVPPTSQCSRCSDLACTFPIAANVEVFSIDVDMNDFNGCNLTLSWSYCCLNSAITTLSPSYFYTEAKLNRCNKDQNSPKFEEIPAFFVIKGKPVELYQTVIPGNRDDSVVYRLARPLQGKNNAYAYITGYGYDHPIMYNGSAISDPKPAGFHFDKYSGELAFLPKKTDVSLMAIEADEYQKDASGNYYLVSSIMRVNEIMCIDYYYSDTYYPVINGITNSASDSVYTCSNNALKIQVRSFDQNNKDSLFISAMNETGGSVSYSSARFPTTTLNWTPANKDVRRNPYKLILTALDNNRPMCGMILRAFYIFVNDSLPSVSISKKNNGCGMYDFAAVPAFDNGLKYQWFIDNRIVSLNKSFSDTIRHNGYHYIDLQVTNAAGCTRHFYDTLQIKSLPVLVFKPEVEVCKGSGTTLKVTGATRYKWTPATGLSSDTGSTVYASPGSTTTYFVTGYDSKNCAATDSIAVIADTFKINFNPDTTVCQGTYLYLHQHIDKAKSYTWKNRNGVQMSDTAGMAFIVTRDTIYYLTITDSFGCTKTVSGIIRTDKIKANAGKDVSICAFDSTRLHASGGTIYQWRYAPGYISDKTVPDPVVHPVQSQNYIVNVSDSLGCASADTVRVTVHQIQPVTNNTLTICEGDSIQLYANGGVFYHWSPATGIIHPDIPNPYARPVTTTTYSVTICDSFCGCKVIDSQQVIVVPFKPVNAGINTEKCEGDTFQLGGPSLPGYSYSWYNIPGSFSSASSKINLKATVSSVYYVTTKNTYGCASTDSAKIKVFKKINSAILGPDSACRKFPAYYQAGTNDTSHLYTWLINGGRYQLGAPNAVNVLWDSLKGTRLILIESYHRKCADTMELPVKILPKPVPRIATDKDICVGTISLFTDSGSADGKSFLWQFGDGFGAKIKSYRYSYSKPGSYNVILIKSNGICTETDTTTVNVHEINIQPVIIHSGFRQYQLTINDTLQLTGQWNTGDNRIIKQNNVTHSYRKNGTYKVNYKYTTPWKCDGSFDTTLVVNDSIPPVYTDTVFIAPNPFRDELTIYYSLSASKNIQFTFYDALGRVLFTKEQLNLSPGNYQFAIHPNDPTVRNGIYLLKYKSGDKVTVFKALKM